MTHKFRALRELGYKNVLPIIPPEVAIYEKSQFYALVGTSTDPRGKAPGVKRGETWGGLSDWQHVVATDWQLDRWEEMGAGAGLRLGDGLIGIDIDAGDQGQADAIEKAALAMLGPSPMRVGRWPRRGLFYRITEDVPYSFLEFDAPDGRRDKIEIMTNTKQMVMVGPHPKTGRPYEWRRELPHRSRLSEITPAALDQFLAAQKQMLPNAKRETLKGGSERPEDQAKLRGDAERITRAVRATPNNRDIFPSRDHYIRMGAAIKASLPDDQELAFDLWTEWAAKDEGGVPELWAKDWKGLGDKFTLGADYVFNMAREHGDGSDFVEDYGDAPVASEKPEASKTEAKKPEPIKWTRPSDWAGRTPAEREWEVEGWIPRYEVCLLYGDGGIGKTLAIHQYATAAAAGVDWLGQRTRQARVMCFFCEDSEDELLRRQIDINALLGVTFEDTDERLRIASRKYMDNLLALWDRNSGAMKRQAVWDQLLADAVAFKADVLVVDTIADTYGGNEIDRAQVNAFVKSCLGRLAQEIGGTVIALGHPSMSGKQSGSGTSGSTAWSNAVRSRMYLRYPKGVEKGNVRELEGMKLNYGPKGALLKLRWERGAFEVIASNVPAARSAVADKRALGASVEDAARDALVAAVRMCPDVVMNMKKNSPYFAPKVLRARQGDLLEAFNDQEVEAEMRRMEGDGTLSIVEVGRSPTRHPLYGYVVRDNMSGNKDLFE